MLFYSTTINRALKIDDMRLLIVDYPANVWKTNKNAYHGLAAVMSLEYNSCILLGTVLHIWKRSYQQ